MKTILEEVYMSRYSVSNHLEFHKVSYQLCDKYGTVIDATEMITGYHSALSQEENVYKWVRRSDFTEKKAKTDRKRTKIYTGMMELLRTLLKHFDPSLRDNARHVYNLLESYSELTTAGYDVKTADIDSLIARLRSEKYILAVQGLELEPWLTELDSQNHLFKSYVEGMTQELLKKPLISPKTARRETDSALRRILSRVTALANLHNPEKYAAFIEEFNVLANHYDTLLSEHYGRLHAKTDIAPADIAPIRIQTYTGKPVYVIPAVSLRKAAANGTETVVELVFSEDFTVAYKNNVEPGTATLIIQGIGKYNGEITTTFNIQTAS